MCPFATLPLFVPLRNIYFSSDEVDGAVPAQFTSDVPIELKERVSKKFTIGPTVQRDFWKKERATMDISRGPCRWYLPSVKFMASNCLKGQVPGSSHRVLVGARLIG
ncbi:hypothetical protein N7539_008802 [Penicillium diatomitis]|uniref:Uncharacterized protein n=1 Tax=Penicillium diatomitis TaxID=2819901 RepID=A0A9W9WQP3_9EURO|nr:uncharacterized protein N7539_008802 [Penicillium diatomitis]KAJ5471859.1 hypothetical protein N7539_008802 [Penicillium diatomitis]